MSIIYQFAKTGSLLKMLRLLLLGSLVAIASARRSPNAHYIEELVKAGGPGRYSDNIIEDALLDVPGLVAKYGYPIEVHTLTTPDGYILEIHRIPHGRDQNNTPDSNKPVVFLMHGLLTSSADFLVLGPGSALGYTLAEAGFDVWLGNARGNYYSRGHETLSTDGGRGNTDYWMFSWDEIGNMDLPTVIDHIIATTGQPKLHYIGYSQGGTTFLVLNSLRPEYTDKFLSFQALAPAAFFINNENRFFQTFSSYEAVLEELLISAGYVNILSTRDFFTWVGINLCADGAIAADLCAALLGGANPEYLNSTMIPIFIGHAPAGAAARQVVHYGQNINSHRFRRYNDLPIKNIEQYGRPTPPDYDLSRITVPAYLHFGYADDITHYKDINYLGDRLPNVAGRLPADRVSFDHIDFILSTDAKLQIYDKLVDIMLSYH